MSAADNTVSAEAKPASRPLLEVKDLNVRFSTPEGEVHAVNSLDFSISPGEVMAIVGESGSGKTQTSLAIMGLLAENGSASGEVLYHGHDLLAMERSQLNSIRGSEIAMIFQDPGASLNPYLTIGTQMTEVLVRHRGMTQSAANARACEMLHQVRLTDADRRMRQYPHELSGGMQQRIMIAMGLLCRPRLLIADEPTTALDVTVQADINQLMMDLRRKYDTAILLITHDLGVVAGLADTVAVIYAGQMMEYAPVRDLYYRPQHPYSRGLVRSVPRLDQRGDQVLRAIPGNPPNLLDMPSGCPFRDRCEHAYSDCTAYPLLRTGREDSLVRCHLDKLPD